MNEKKEFICCKAEENGMCWACGVYVSEEKLYKCELCAVDRFCEKCIVMAQCACTKREGTWKDYYAFISKQMEKTGNRYLFSDLWKHSSLRNCDFAMLSCSHSEKETCSFEKPK